MSRPPQLESRAGSEEIGLEAPSLPLFASQFVGLKW